MAALKTLSVLTDARQSGVWPTQRAGGTADAVAGAARQVDSDDAIVRTARRVARRIRGPEDRDDGHADRDGQVHRSGVAGDQQVEPLEDGGDRQQVEISPPHRSR